MSMGWEEVAQTALHNRLNPSHPPGRGQTTGRRSIWKQATALTYCRILVDSFAILLNSGYANVTRQDEVSHLERGGWWSLDQVTALSGHKISAMGAVQNCTQRETAIWGGRKKGQEASGRHKLPEPAWVSFCYRQWVLHGFSRQAI